MKHWFFWKKRVNINPWESPNIFSSHFHGLIILCPFRWYDWIFSTSKTKQNTFNLRNILFCSKHDITHKTDTTKNVPKPVICVFFIKYQHKIIIQSIPDDIAAIHDICHPLFLFWGTYAWFECVHWSVYWGVIP